MVLYDGTIHQFLLLSTLELQSPLQGMGKTCWSLLHSKPAANYYTIKWIMPLPEDITLEFHSPCPTLLD